MRRGTTRSGIAYTVGGSGVPVLLVGGYATAAATLDGLAQRLSRSYTCITFDHPGTGRSHASITLTSNQLAKRAAEVLDAVVGRSPVHVCGFSLGGMVAQELALREPARVRSLVLVSTSAGGIHAYPASPWLVPRTLVPSSSGPLSRGSSHPIGLLSQAMAAATHDAGGRLSRLALPTLVVHGGRDQLLPARNGRSLARLLPGARLVVLPGAGHLLAHKDQRTFADLLVDWLAEQETTTGEILPPARTPVVDAVLQAAGSPARRVVAGWVTGWRVVRAALLPY